MRAVLDVNVLISAEITPEGESRARLHQAEGNFVLLLSDFILQQVERVLHYPHIQAHYPHLTPAEIAEYVAYLRETGRLVHEITRAAVCPDPEYNRILAAAVDGQADYLVTRNLSHFPSTYDQVNVVSPADFHRFIRQAQQ